MNVSELRVKVEGRAYDQVFSGLTNLSGFGDAATACNTVGTSLGNDTYWHPGRQYCYGSTHFGVSTADAGDVHINLGGFYYGHFHISSNDTGQYWWGDYNGGANLVNETEWVERYSYWVRESATSCAEVLQRGNTTSGLYSIDPDGAGAGLPFTAYCDMTTRGGGWTLVAVNGKDGRPGSFTGNSYPRPGASFYGTAAAAMADIAGIKAATNDATINQYSIGAKDLFAASGREFMAYVGGTTQDYIYGTIPGTCNFFDGASFCAESGAGVTPFTVYTSANAVVSATAIACTSITTDSYNEFGLHILAAEDNLPSLHCFGVQGGNPVGHQDYGRVYTTFNESNGGYWNAGVHSHWADAGQGNTVGFLMVR